jgi:hypothetical protein
MAAPWPHKRMQLLSWSVAARLWHAGQPGGEGGRLLQAGQPPAAPPGPRPPPQRTRLAWPAAPAPAAASSAAAAAAAPPSPPASAPPAERRRRRRRRRQAAAPAARQRASGRRGRPAPRPARPPAAGEARRAAAGQQGSEVGWSALCRCAALAPARSIARLLPHRSGVLRPQRSRGVLQAHAPGIVTGAELQLLLHGAQQLQDVSRAAAHGPRRRSVRAGARRARATVNIAGPGSGGAAAARSRALIGLSIGPCSHEVRGPTAGGRAAAAGGASPTPGSFAQGGDPGRARSVACGAMRGTMARWRWRARACPPARPPTLRQRTRPDKGRDAHRTTHAFLLCPPQSRAARFDRPPISTCSLAQPAQLVWDSRSHELAVGDAARRQAGGREVAGFASDGAAGQVRPAQARRGDSSGGAAAGRPRPLSPRTGAPVCRKRVRSRLRRRPASLSAPRPPQAVRLRHRRHRGQRRARGADRRVALAPLHGGLGWAPARAHATPMAAARPAAPLIARRARGSAPPARAGVVPSQQNRRGAPQHAPAAASWLAHASARPPPRPAGKDGFFSRAMPEVHVPLPTDKLTCKRAAPPPRTPAVLVSCGSFNPPTGARRRCLALLAAARACRAPPPARPAGEP